MKRFIPYILLTLILIATYTLIIRRFDLDTVEKLEAAFNERQSIAVNLSARSLEDWYRSLLDRLELVGQRPVFHTFNPLAASQTQQEIGLLLRQNLDTVFLAAAYVRQSVSPVVIQFDAARDLEHDTALLTHWVNLYASSVMASGEPFVTPIEAAPDEQLFGILYPINTTHALAVIVNFSPALERYIVPIRSGTHGAAWVQDLNGQVIYDHETQIIGQNARMLNMDYPQVQAIYDRFLSEHYGTGEYRFTVVRGGDVQRKLTAWHNAMLGNQVITIALAAPDTEVSQELANTRLLSLVLGGAFVVLLLSAGAVTYYWQQRDLFQIVRERTTVLLNTNTQLQLEIAERKQAEAALEAERNLLLTVIDTIPDYISVKDRDGNYLLVNQIGVVGRKQKSREDIIGKTDFDFLREERALEYQREEKRVIQTGVPLMDQEGFYKMLTGEEKWLLSSRVPFRNHKDEIVGVVTVSRDITQLKVTEETLRREQRLFTRGPVVVFRGRANATWDMEYVSPNVTQFGYLPEAFTEGNLHFRDLLHPEDQGHVLHSIEENTLAGLTSFEMEYRIITANHEVVWLNDFMTIVRDQYGLATHFDSYVLDITERKTAENELRLSDEILQQMPDAIILTDMSGIITRWMGSAEELFGYTAQEAVGQPVEMIHTSRVHGIQREGIFANIAETGQYQGEIPCLTKNGEEIPVDVTVKSVLDSKGNHIATIGINRDLTERKRAEQQALELRVERERSYMMSDFVQNASHQFRTPLSIIHTKLYLMNRILQDNRLQKHLEGIQEQADQILNLIEALVLMVRLDSQDDLDFHPLHIDMLVRELPTWIQNLLDEKQLQYSTDFAPDLPQIMGNVNDLYDAVCRIIENAVRYSSEAGSIRLSTYLENDHAVIAVADCGIGIPEDEIPYIFERFYRVDKAHTLLGFGLGLSIARKIVENHRGQIDVTSTIGEGSTFRIMLPIMRELRVAAGTDYIPDGNTF